MSSTSLDQELQERLREASAIGDIDEVRTLVESGVNVNSQNEINGWTCLHWACKRNHKHIVSYLLNSGADMDILTAKDELASQLTSKPEIKRLLGVEVEDMPEMKEAELPIIPNYLSNPPFMYSKLDNKVEVLVARLHNQNGSGDHEQEDPAYSPSPTHQPQPPVMSPVADNTSAHSGPSSSSTSPTHQPQPPVLSPVADTPNARFVPSFSTTPVPLSQPGPTAGASVPVAEQNGVSPGIHNNHYHHQHPAVNGVLPMDFSVEPHLINHADYPPHVVHNGPVCTPPRASPSPSPGTASSSGSQVQAPVAGAHPAMTRQPSIPQQISCGQAAGGGAMPAFQPFFFTSTFPVNVQELVLKVRIQNPNARENDFIEIELDRQELTFRSLLRVCCRELDISAEHVEKIRKLPNTMLRKDKDVARLQDFQELEVVIEKAEGMSIFSGTGALTDRPCYNMKASRLTY
ncbi:Ankyrin repeat domain-containing protein 40 [Merluccius polli]|uniref:Ankyrin repeat domain-containing protein 40 n=1 Tax=Merluccius polli TaxID=89951 RepID=A0AA47NC26_MERPO|nr:Ankyrin repeat domain-containing protein 40 [Merluccius polli]